MTEKNKVAVFWNTV